MNLASVIISKSGSLVDLVAGNASSYKIKRNNCFKGTMVYLNATYRIKLKQF